MYGEKMKKETKGERNETGGKRRKEEEEKNGTRGKCEEKGGETRRNAEKKHKNLGVVRSVVVAKEGCNQLGNKRGERKH
jgi:hypothetical protein